MHIQLPHKETKQKAIERVKSLLKEHQVKIKEHAEDVRTGWKDNVLDFEFTAQGTHISGTLTVNDSDYDIYAKLPLMFRMFEGTIEKMIVAEMKKMGV